MNVHVACRFLPYEFNIQLFVQAVFLLQIMFFKYNPIENNGLRLCYSLIHWLLL